MLVSIKSIETIEDKKYGKCLLVDSYPIIDSPLGWGGCVDMTRIVRLLYPDNKKNEIYLHKAKLNTSEYFEFAENGAFVIDNVPNWGECYVHNSFNENTEFSVQVGNAVDLGLSVLWADMNVGASVPSDYGKLFGYGDPSGEKWSGNENEYPKIDIIGTEYDIAKVNWGGKWRMPTVKELEEISEKCSWKPSTLNGVKGNEVTGPNGNTIFFPFAGNRIEANICRAGQIGACWAGNLSNFGSSVNMLFFGCSATLNYGANASWGVSVRPVMDK